MEETFQQTRQLLDYLASQEGAVLRYSASEMIVVVHSNTGYLNKTKEKARQALLSVNK